MNLTAELLHRSQAPSSTSMKSLDEQEHAVWNVRFSILLRLNMASIAEIEMQPFNSFENPDLFAEFFNVPINRSTGGLTSLVPFGTRLLHAQLPLFLQRPNEALSRLNKLLQSSQKIIDKLCEIDPNDSESISLWQRRSQDVSMAMANVFIAGKHYREACDAFDRVLTADSTPGERKSKLAALAGRAMMQAGCLPQAERYLSAACYTASSADADFLRSLHNGYLKMSTGRFEEAAEQFEQAVSKVRQMIFFVFFYNYYFYYLLIIFNLGR